MLDATDLKARPTASSLIIGGSGPRLISGPKGGMTQQNSMGSATAKVVPDGSTCVRGNAVASPVLMCCSRTAACCRGDWGSRV